MRVLKNQHCALRALIAVNKVKGRRTGRGSSTTGDSVIAPVFDAIALCRADEQWPDHRKDRKRTANRPASWSPGPINMTLRRLTPVFRRLATAVPSRLFASVLGALVITSAVRQSDGSSSTR
jgi:hypothetical protein